MLDLIDEGFWPVPKVFKSPISSEVLQKSKLEGFQYKVVQKGDYAELYLRLSEVENYIVHRNSSGNYYKRSMYEEIPQEVRELFYAGKTTIGIPFGQVGSVPCQAMTTQEAREFMERTMEERFQEYWKSMRK